jgi:beta-lactamase class A
MRLLLVLLLLLSLVAPATGLAEEVWSPDVAAAAEYARHRSGVVAFAVVDEDGTIRGKRLAATAPMASVFKVMLMVTYLRRPSVRHRDLRAEDRRLLGPMIRWSDNATATRIRDIVGGPALHRLARDAGMRDFRLHPTWGLSRTSPRDQARLMFSLEDFIPDRHDDTARRLLSSIVRSQRWGIPRAAPAGWDVYFKGGWGSGTGRVTHQVAFLEQGDRRIAVAILTEFSPSHGYGTRTVRGVAARLFRGLDA